MLQVSCCWVWTCEGALFGRKVKTSFSLYYWAPAVRSSVLPLPWTKMSFYRFNSLSMTHDVATVTSYVKRPSFRGCAVMEGAFWKTANFYVLGTIITHFSTAWVCLGLIKWGNKHQRVREGLDKISTVSQTGIEKILQYNNFGSVFWVEGISSENL